jgi:hypothetical protein
MVATDDMRTSSVFLSLDFTASLASECVKCWQMDEAPPKRQLDFGRGRET